MVGARGFEPPASCPQNRRATRLRHAPISDLLNMLFSSMQGYKCPYFLFFEKKSLIPWAIPLVKSDKILVSCNFFS